MEPWEEYQQADERKRKLEPWEAYQQADKTAKQTAKEELLALPQGVGKGISGTAYDALSYPIRMIGRLYGRGEGADALAEFGQQALSSRAPTLDTQDREALLGKPAIQTPIPQALDRASEAALPYSPRLLTDYNTEEPSTTTGRVLEKVGEAVGAQLPFTGGIYGSARALRPLIGPRHPAATVPQSERLLGPIRDYPGRFAAGDIAGAAGFGGAMQGAQEADFGLPAQIGLGLAGGLVAPLAMSSVLRGETGALGPFRTWRDRGADLPAGTPSGLSPGWEKAYQQLADVATRAGVPRGQVSAMLRRFEEAVGGLHSNTKPPDQAALVDFLESWMREAGSLRRQYTGAADIIGGSIEARQRGYTDKPTAPGIQTIESRAEPYTTPYTKEVYTEKGVDAGQHARMMEEEAKALRIWDEKHHGFGKDAEATAALIVAERERDAKQLWGNVRMAGRGVDISQMRPVQLVLDNFRNAAARLPPDIQAKILHAIEQYAPGGKVHSDIIAMNHAKRSVGDSIADMTKPTASNTDSTAARYLTRLNQQMVWALSRTKQNNLGALYRNANRAFAGKSEELRHIKLGQQIYNNEVPVSAFDALKGDRAAQNLVKHGFHGETRRESASMRSARDRTLMFDSPAQREKRAYLIERSETPGGKPTREFVRGDRGHGTDAAGYALDADGIRILERPGFDRPEHFGELVEQEKRMIQTRDVSRGGSQTALNQADDAMMQAADTLNGVYDALKDTMKGGPGAITAAKRLAELAYTRAMGPGADVADIKANILFTADPALRRTHLANIMMRMGTTRFQRWLQIMGDSASRGARRETGGVLRSKEQEQ